MSGMIDRESGERRTDKRGNRLTECVRAEVSGAVVAATECTHGVMHGYMMKDMREAKHRGADEK